MLWPMNMRLPLPFEHLIKTLERIDRLELVTERIVFGASR